MRARVGWSCVVFMSLGRTWSHITRQYILVIARLVLDEHVANSMDNDVKNEIHDSKPTNVLKSSDNTFDVVHEMLNEEFTDPDENQKSTVNHGDT